MKTTRSELRERIMTILYQINVYRKEKMEYDIDEVVKENDKENNSFVRDIVFGVMDNESVLDNVINKYLKDWTVSRLGNIDKAIFEMSTYELLFTKTPKVVSINEGIELSKKFSDEKVTKMLNAVLDEILKQFVEKEIYNLCCDKNGNHVFQKIIRVFPKSKNDFIYTQLRNYAKEISKLKQGVSILQAAIEYANEIHSKYHCWT